MPAIIDESPVISTAAEKKESLASAASPTPDIPHTLVGSFYTLENGVEAKLLLNNKGPVQLEVQPTLYSFDGQELQLQPVYVEPQSGRYINLQDWATIGGPSFQSGNVKLVHYGKDLVLGAQIYLTDEARSLTFEEKLAEIGKFNSTRLETLWWMPSNNVDVRVVLTNTGSSPLTVTGILSKKPNQSSAPRSLTIAPHSSKQFDIREEFPGSNSFLNSDIVALSLEHCGAPESLLARVFIYEATKGYSNFAQFSNPAGGKSSEYHGVGFQIEDIGPLKFNPVIVVRNVGTTDSDVTVNIPYTRNNGTQGNIDLPVLDLSPGEMREVKTNKIVQRVAAENIKVASIEAAYTSAPGSILVASHSNSNDHNQVFRVPMWDPLNQRSATGGYPWQIEASSVTETYIKNISDLEEDYTVTLFWENGGMYTIGRRSIAAHETVHIDTQKLRDDQIPDTFGRTIPLSISSGQLQWSLRRKDNLPLTDRWADLALMGRSEQVDLTKQIVNNYACVNCCYDSVIEGSGRIAPEFSELEVGGSAVNFEAYESTQNCYGGFTGEWLVGAASWSSTDSCVTIDSNGTAFAQTAGDATITAAWDGLVRYTTEPCESRPFEANSPDCFKGSEPASEILAPNDGGDGGTCGSCGHYTIQLGGSGNATVTAQVTVQKIQYKTPGTSDYVDISGTLYVLKGTTVEFKAIPNPTNATFPSGQPTWSGTSGATGTGQTLSVEFSTVSPSTSNFKTVVATSGNPSVTVNVIVFDLAKVVAPVDTWTGRATTTFGLKELVNLSTTITPSGVTSSQAGGLQWEIASGSGTIPPNTNNDGTGEFTAPASPGNTTLRLNVLSGPSKDKNITEDVTTIKPSGTNFALSTGRRHTQGRVSAGFKAIVYFEPKNVSFKNISFSEGECAAETLGYLYGVGTPHAAGSENQILLCNGSTGCRGFNEDTCYMFHPETPSPTPYGDGFWNWPIPWFYHSGGTPGSLFTVNQLLTTDESGNATISKGGVSVTFGVNDATISTGGTW